MANVSLLLTGLISTLWTRTPFFLPRGDHCNTSTVLTQPSTLACAKECSRAGERCSSFSYTPSNATCRLHASVYVSGDVSGSEVTTKHYRVTSENCPVKDNGFLLDRVSDMCLLVVTSPPEAAWQDARNACYVRGLSLVSLYTSSRLEFVISVLGDNPRFHPKDYYIGGRRVSPGPEGRPDFRWLHNDSEVDTATTQFWRPGEPDNQDEQKTVLALQMWKREYRLSGHINATTDGKTLGYICEK